jgi:hypothetical protein
MVSGKRGSCFSLEETIFNMSLQVLKYRLWMCSGSREGSIVGFYGNDDEPYNVIKF